MNLIKELEENDNSVNIDKIGSENYSEAYVGYFLQSSRNHPLHQTDSLHNNKQQKEKNHKQNLI